MLKANFVNPILKDALGDLVRQVRRLETGVRQDFDEVVTNGVAACLAKSISSTELEIVIHELGETKLQLEAA